MSVQGKSCTYSFPRHTEPYYVPGTGSTKDDCQKANNKLLAGREYFSKSGRYFLHEVAQSTMSLPC
jgi:hypothetical protein